MIHDIRRLLRNPISLPTAMKINPACILMLPVVLLAACASDPSTAVAPSASSSLSTQASADPFADPVYDTPAAYEESAASTTTTASADPINATASDSSAAALPDHAPATIHTVVKGDTLSGLSAKYRVPMASIMSANRMTDDKVILGRKMVIPPR